MGNTNAPPDPRPVQPSGAATGFYTYPSDTVLAKNSAELITILRSLRTNLANTTIRTVQLLGKVIYDITEIVVEYQNALIAERYLYLPNLVSLNDPASVVMSVAATAPTTPDGPLFLIPLLNDMMVTYTDNVIFQVIIDDPNGQGPFEPVRIGVKNTVDLGYTRAFYEMRRVSGNMSVEFGATFSGTPDVIFTGEECQFRQVRLDGTAAANVRNSTIAMLRFEQGDVNTLQLNWNLDNCLLTGFTYRPKNMADSPVQALSYDITNTTTVWALTCKNCRFIGDAAVEAVRTTGTGDGGLLILQNCTFDWNNTVLVDLTNTTNKAYVFLLGVFDLQPSAANKFTESLGGVVGSNLGVGVTNLVPSNFAGVTVATKTAALIG